MKKKYYVYCSITVFTFILSLYCLYAYRNSISDPEDVLSAAFDFSGANILRSEIYLNGELGDGFDSAEKLEKLVLDLSGDLGIVKGKRSSAIQEPSNKIELSGDTDHNVHIEINVKERNISVRLEKDQSRDGLKDAGKTAATVLGKYGVEPKINSLVTGTFNGNLDPDMLETTITQALDGIKAEKVEGIREGGLISLSAYTPELKDFVRANGKRINVNLAARYNTLEDKTYIWLASPVITTEY